MSFVGAVYVLSICAKIQLLTHVRETQYAVGPVLSREAAEKAPLSVRDPQNPDIASMLYLLQRLQLDEVKYSSSVK